MSLKLDARPWALAALVACLTPMTARSDATVLRLSWNDCTPIVVNQNSLGAGTYRWNISATNMSGHYDFFEARLRISPPRVPSAWEFYDRDYTTLVHGCQGPTRISVVTTGASCPQFPLLTSAGFVMESIAPSPTQVYVDENLDKTFTPVPGQRYVLAQIVFDHSASVEGSAGAGQCGGLELPMCIGLNSTLQFQNQFGNYVPVAPPMEQSFLTWQDPQNALHCPGATPAAAATWGAVKAQYR